MNEAGMEEKRKYLAALRKGRAAAFRSEVVPYFRYVAQSGFGLVVAAAVFMGIFGYADLLQDIPEHLQDGLIGAAAIACAAIWAPLRTYMRLADTVFLLPLEGAVVRHYIRPALRYAAGAGILRVLIVYILFIPLYLKAPETADIADSRSLWLLGILLALVTVWNAGGGWAERRMVGIGARMIVRIARIAATFLMCWALLNGPFIPALGLTAGCMLLLVLMWRAIRSVRLPWERLIHEEARTVRRWRRFLSWFVDMPTEEARPTRRRWAAWFGNRLPWKREWAWQYWYAKTFARGETFGAWLKWLLVIGFILIIVDNAAADWISYTIGFAIGGIQLTEMASIRLDVSMRTLPIKQDQRGAAAGAVTRRVGIAGTALLWLLTAVPYGAIYAISWTSLAMLTAGMAWSAWFIPRRLAKPRDEDDD